MPLSRSRGGARGEARPLLAPGELVGVAAPGFAVPPGALRAGVAALEALGLRVRRGRHLLAREGYLAGPDEARASDVEELIDDPEVRGIWFARGGFGTTRLLPRLLDARAPRARAGKVLVGYSDLTALFAHAAERWGARCLYGPVVTELGDRAAYHRGSLVAALRGEPRAVAFPASRALSRGRAAGPLAGGTLAVLAHLCGTPFAPRFAGCIVLLEDVGEETYSIDRALTQLVQSEALAEATGVAIGALRPVPRRRFPPDRRLRDVLADHLVPLGVPVALGLPLGHCRGKHTVPLGARAELDTARGVLGFPR